MHGIPSGTDSRRNVDNPYTHWDSGSGLDIYKLDLVGQLLASH